MNRLTTTATWRGRRRDEKQHANDERRRGEAGTTRRRWERDAGRRPKPPCARCSTIQAKGAVAPGCTEERRNQFSGFRPSLVQSPAPASVFSPAASLQFTNAPLQA